MEVINLSAESMGKVRSWLPQNLQAERVVFLPDACPGKSPLPTGTVVLTKQQDWRQFAVSDCGCGMRLLKSEFKPEELSAYSWDKVASKLQANKGKLGDLGGGNHFLDALAPHIGNSLYFLIHTGSRSESGLVDAYIDKPKIFDAEFERIVKWAAENRAAVQLALEDVFGKLKLVLDLPHNTFEQLPDGGAIIRKGAVRVTANELNIIPSHMSGDIALVRATEKVSDTLFSLSHGTGRTMSRAECKPYADDFDFNLLRQQILIPASVQNSSLRTDGPFAYRNLDDCLALLSEHIDVVERFSVIGYMGHL